MESNPIKKEPEEPELPPPAQNDHNTPSPIIVCLYDISWSMQLPGAAPAVFPYDESSEPILTAIRRNHIPAPLIDILDVPQFVSKHASDGLVGGKAQLLPCWPRVGGNARLPHCWPQRGKFGQVQTQSYYITSVASSDDACEFVVYLFCR